MYKGFENAEVIAIFPDKIRIAIHDIEDFQKNDSRVKVGNFIRIVDDEGIVMIAMIEVYNMEYIPTLNGEVIRRYFLEAVPLGLLLKNGLFIKGGTSISIPPRVVEPAHQEEIRKIFEESISKDMQLTFASLSSDEAIKVPVDGNKFFNKHIAIIGSTGSGKSHTVARILQHAISQKNTEFQGLNNSHIVIFDIHSEYKSAFPNASFIDIEKLVLPYWLMNGAELEEFFVEAGPHAYNQISIFKEAVVNSKKTHFEGYDESSEEIVFDSPVYFDLDEVVEYLIEKDEERVPGSRGDKAGPYNGKLTRLINRISNKMKDNRLKFLLGENVKETSLKATLNQLIGLDDRHQANITILDLSGVPYDVLNTTVSLVSRIIFEFGYYYKRMKRKIGEDTTDFPILLVFEEAHKYVPNDHSSTYRSSRESIERIAKEGRKYGVTLLLASQRPAEISETVFSQCNNFIALRLTNPIDQRYVKKLLPDSMGRIVDRMPTLQVGEALLTGDAVVLPSIVKIEKCIDQPSSNDIPYWKLWGETWHTVDDDSLINTWEI